MRRVSALTLVEQRAQIHQVVRVEVGGATGRAFDEVAEQRACIFLSPVATNHREDYYGNLIQCRFPHLQ